jgi:hypothetical protein
LQCFGYAAAAADGGGDGGHRPAEISFGKPKEIAQSLVISRNFMPFNVNLNVFSGRKKARSQNRAKIYEIS